MTTYSTYNNPTQGIALYYDYLEADESILLDHVLKKFNDKWEQTKDEVHPKCILMTPMICLTDQIGRVFQIVPLSEFLRELSKRVKAGEQSSLFDS